MPDLWEGEKKPQKTEVLKLLTLRTVISITPIYAVWYFPTHCSLSQVQYIQFNKYYNFK